MFIVANLIRRRHIPSGIAFLLRLINALNVKNACFNLFRPTSAVADSLALTSSLSTRGASLFLLFLLRYLGVLFLLFCDSFGRLR